MNMNLFHQLESQAIEYARSVCNSAGNCIVYDDGKEVVFTFHEVISQKLAELVIRECLDIIDDERYNTMMLTSMPMQSGAIFDARCNIKSHFGIE